ncbi:hypothetical protein [Pseudomonas paraeruginosa]|uniref:hypothetical protein n=1 Tax=Pseudomonas paraeruginosa TaxID=2994495 RepID=UPI002A6AAA07|nr:hypothetical protein [Pseudomonas paraeruginosa]MDY1586987.1 hypothetical protein [Pseudomonas paraeruginosa]
MSSIQLIEQCVTRLRGIIEALDNIHDTSPHRWSTDLDDVHSSAESLLALIKDQAPAPCIDCKGTGFCNSISGEEIRCPCRAPIQFADPAQSPVEQLEQAPPSEDQLTAAGLSYPLAKEDAVKLWYSGFRSEVITVLEAWEAIGHDTGINPDKEELLESLRNMAAICNAHGNDMPAQSAIDRRQVIADAITGALAFGAQASQPPAEDHWLRPFYDIGRAEGQRTQELAMLVRMLASSLKRHAPESNLVARATNYLAAKGLAGTPLRDAPASVEQVGGDERAAFELFVRKHCGMPAHIAVNWDAKFTNDAWAGWQARAALAQPSPAQAEQAERPEVVARVVHSNPVVLDQCAPLNANDEMMTVAQHAASVARWAEMFNRVEQERDAALAEVERLTRDRDDCLKARLHYATQHGLSLARVAELTATRNRYGVDAHYFNKNLQRILRDFESFTPDELARSLIILAKVADEKVVAQAQHNVPELDQSRSALTEAQMRRIYENSTEIENERLGFAAFARLMRRAEAVHQIAAAPQPVAEGE